MFMVSPQPYTRNVVGGAVNFVDIVVEPLDDANYKINVMLLKVCSLTLVDININTPLQEGLDAMISPENDRVVSGEAVRLHWLFCAACCDSWYFF